MKSSPGYNTGALGPLVEREKEWAFESACTRETASQRISGPSSDTIGVWDDLEIKPKIPNFEAYVDL